MQSQTQNTYEKLFHLSNDLVCLASTDGYFKMVNPAFTAVLGWDESYLLSKTYFEFIHPEDWIDTEKELSKLSAGIPTINFTIRFRTANGAYRWLQWTVTPEAATGHLFAIGRNVTAEIEQEQQLKDSERKFRAFFENAQGLMCLHDLEGNLIAVNPSSAQCIGYTVAELEQMSLFDIIHPEDHSNIRRYLQEIQHNAFVKGVMRTLHRDGSTRIWLFNNTMEKNYNGPSYVIGNALDITEHHLLETDLKRTKEMLEQTNRVARIGAWELNLVKQQIYWTTLTRELHEVDDNFVPTLENVLQFYKPGENQEIIKNAVNKAMKDGSPWDLELEMTTAKGRDIWVKAIGYAEFEQGKCKRLYGTIQDVTSAALQREELREAKLLAEHANKAKSEFLANMSHEIRTPLNGIIGFTDLLLKMEMNATQYQYLSIVNESANSLLNIINDILDFSKIEADKLELDITRSDILEISSQVSDLVKYQSESKQIEMLLNVSPELPRFIRVDNVRLKQILVNLLTNAVKFTEKGEIELKISFVDSPATGYITLRFEVRDTGIGISPEHQQSIFQAFSQADLSITKKYGGTGLGLTISNRLLGLMGSQLQLHSETGKGSVFFFELTVQAELGATLTQGGLDHIKHVLIVDDNENNCTIIEQMLLLKNISSHKAKNGFEALHLLAQGNEYDVLILDYHMPYMDGLETIRKIRANFPRQTEILLHSSSDDEVVMRACTELQVAFRLIKPIKSQDLYNALSGLHQRTGKRSATITTKLSAQQGMKVLIAEDNQVNMLLARTIVERAVPDVTVIESWDGKQAVSDCMIHQPDLILMDIQMPVMNGYEATAMIRAQYSTTLPIIALTAGNVKGERERCLAAGMNDFLAKPFVEASILTLLKKWT